jgi:hypothetical protein
VAEAAEAEPAKPPSYAELSVHYGDLIAQVDAMRLDVERLLTGGGAGQKGGKSGLFGRLLGRAPEQAEPPPDPTDVARRLDTLRVEVAVDRERSLRTLVELEKVALQKQLTDALARLRQTEGRGAQPAPASSEPIPLPFGAKSPPRPEDRVFLEQPPQGNRPNRPR